MTDAEPQIEQQGDADEEMAERLRPLVNDILETFNQQQISPSEAGMVIMSLTYRLLEVLKEAPEARRHFILGLINLINNLLVDEMEKTPVAKGGLLVKEDF